MDEIKEFPQEGSLEDREEKQDDSTFDYQQGYGYPEHNIKDSQFKLFRDINMINDSKKVANVDSTELYNVRLYRDLSIFCERMGWKSVNKYLTGYSENILATSMSKKGFFLTTMVTQFRKVQRIASQGLQKQGGIFGFRKKEDSDPEV